MLRRVDWGARSALLAWRKHVHLETSGIHYCDLPILDYTTTNTTTVVSFIIHVLVWYVHARCRDTMSVLSPRLVGSLLIIHENWYFEMVRL